MKLKNVTRMIGSVKCEELSPGSVIQEGDRTQLGNIFHLKSNTWRHLIGRNTSAGMPIYRPINSKKWKTGIYAK